MFRILGVVLGSLWGGFLGVVIGYVIGSALDGMFSSRSSSHEDEPHTQTDTYTSPRETDRDRFMDTLLLGITYIIRADGRVMHSEMECARTFLRESFGEDAVQKGNEKILEYINWQKAAPEAFRMAVMASCTTLRSIMNTSQLNILLDYYVLLAQVDGAVPECEVTVLRELASALGFSASVIDQALGLGKDTLDAAYQVLGVPATATDSEVKAAYRKLVIANHPDRVASLGEDIRRAAETKLQQINAAKEKIWKARGLN